MKHVIVNHAGKRAFNFTATNKGDIQFQWIDYVDNEDYSSVGVSNVKEVVKTERLEKGVTKIYYN